MDEIPVWMEKQCAKEDAANAETGHFSRHGSDSNEVRMNRILINQIANCLSLSITGADTWFLLSLATVNFAQVPPPPPGVPNYLP